MILEKVIVVIGARPQFIKHFPLELAGKGKLELITIHTGQHYDEAMSQVFFSELGMSKPNYMLNIGSGTHGAQTGKMMVEIEKIVLEEKPSRIIVYGDTNSTLAGALVAVKLHIPLIHVEAGLRSFNKKMPEEVNRILTDHVSDYLFTTNDLPKQHLENEGITDNTYVVGDLMKDLIYKSIKNNWINKKRKLKEEYYYITIHRPYNTDIKERLEKLLFSLNNLGKKAIFTVHPRTENLINKFKIDKSVFPNIIFIKPQGYIDNLSYLFNSEGLITDSGGMQKEAYWLQKKCVTIRTETEWVETLENGWNTLVFEELDTINKIMKSKNKHYIELYGDGKSAEKIIDIILGTKKKMNI